MFFAISWLACPSLVPSLKWKDMLSQLVDGGAKGLLALSHADTWCLWYLSHSLNHSLGSTVRNSKLASSNVLDLWYLVVIADCVNELRNTGNCGGILVWSLKCVLWNELASFVSFSFTDGCSWWSCLPSRWSLCSPQSSISPTKLELGNSNSWSNLKSNFNSKFQFQPKSQF